MRGVERVCKGEPGTECFVVRRLDVYIVGFECCGTSEERNTMEVRALIEFVEDSERSYVQDHISLACHIVGRKVV